MPEPRPALTPEQIRQLLNDNGLTLEDVAKAMTDRPAILAEKAKKPDPVIDQSDRGAWELVDKYLEAKYPGYQNMNVDWASLQWLNGDSIGQQAGFQVNAIVCLEVPMYAYRPNLKKEKPGADV